MATAWASESDVEASVQFITNNMEINSILSKDQIRANKTKLGISKHTLVRKFYRLLEDTCPAALEYFCECPVQLARYIK